MPQENVKLVRRQQTTRENEKTPAVAGLPRRADDGSRTHDLRLGKPTLYQLSYVRVWR